MDHVLGRSEVWGVRGNLGDKAVKFRPVRYDKRTFPPDMNEGAKRRIATPACRGDRGVHFVDLVRCPIPVGEYFVSVFLGGYINGALMNMVVYTFPFSGG